ncbi:MAG: hypothetical protein LBC27_10235 [Spirochaetaceae bacterium]|jgi:hypothetical protein|nr:hypothetical protein [Spirochaetaceae bacterium]
MKKSVFLTAATLFITAAFFITGCENKEVEVDTSDNGGGGVPPSPAVNYYVNQLIDDASIPADAIKVEGDSITIQKSFTVSKSLYALPGGVTLKVGVEKAAREAADEPVVLNLAKDVNFDVGNGTLILNGEIKVANGIFALSNGTTQLYGKLDLGTGRLASDIPRETGKLIVYPGAVLQDKNGDTERQLVGSKSIALGADSTLEIKGEYADTLKTREITLTGSADLKDEMAIFNNGVNWKEKITLANGAKVNIANGGTLLVIGTTSTIDTLENYISGAENGSGTISCLEGTSGGLAFYTNSNEPAVIIGAGSYATWNKDKWELVPAETEEE